MLESLLNPMKAERRTWELFFVGLFYAFMSVLLVNWIFGSDPVLSKYSGVLLVTFTVMFSMPFIYYTIKLEERKVEMARERGTLSLLKEHKRAIFAFLWLFLGFVVAYALGYIIFSSAQNFQAQIETYCIINRPANFQECVKQYGLRGAATATTLTTHPDRLQLIFMNNIYVLIFTLIFSLIFGAGVIFVLAWNASVIAAAIGVFTNAQWSVIPQGLGRYMIHGIFEIASYFIVALAGGLVSVAVIKHETGTEKFWEVIYDSLILIIVAIIVLAIAAVIEVYVTPLLF